jgi:hypothetical protein
MRRAARNVFHAAAVVSGVLFFISVGFWIASYGSTYRLSTGPTWFRSSAVISRGEMGISICSPRFQSQGPGPKDMGWKLERLAPRDFTTQVSGLSPPDRVPVCGFYFGTVETKSQSGGFFSSPCRSSSPFSASSRSPRCC